MIKNTNLLLSSLVFLLPLSFFHGKFAFAVQNATIPVNIGVVLDFDKWVGKMGLSCIFMALSDFYETHGDYKTRLVLHTRDSKEDIVGAASAAIDLIKNIEVQAIIGPLTLAQANFIADLGNKAQVPIVSFSATSHSLYLARTPYFISATQNDSSQAQAIGAIIQNYGWRAAIPIFEDGGKELLPYLNDALQEFDARIPYCSAIPASATDDQIMEELYKLMTMQTRVFILHMTQSLGSRLLLKAKEVGMMSENYAWILTNGLANLMNSMDSSVIGSIQGALSVKTYVPRSKKLDNFTIRWRRKFEQENPNIQRPELSVFGLWAYDVIWALAMATEKVGGTRFTFQRANNTRNNTDLEAIGVSQIGPQLLQEISRTDFKGLSGNLSFVDGQLQSSMFEIVNVIGNGGRVVGFWTPRAGITRDLNLPASNEYATLKPHLLRPIIWPGDSTTTPKSWAIPSTGKKLRIGIPLPKCFTEFVNTKRDPKTNETMVTGFCIDTFKATLEALPYAVPYEFIPFMEVDNIESFSYYNDLIDQVYLQKFDAAVGDITIIANRSLYVDFTLPYTESGLSLIVPIKDDENKNAWTFLKPLTINLWMTSATFFAFIGFVVWVLEHRINEDFRGPPSHQLGTILWFSFSTLVFSHRERVINNLARFVVIIWVFVVLILNSSYTANLSSMLTVQQLQPPITDIKELLKNNENVGYQEGSFVEGLLKQMNFESSQLKAYRSIEECDKLFSMGSQNGSIAAALDETPYMRLLVAKYCDKYTMVQQRFGTEGFGFVFSKGSPLVLDISRAILNVKEGKKMREIENVWLGNQSSCSNTHRKVPSTSLTLDSFWGLFLIVGVTSFSALAIYLAIFFYNHRHILTRNEASIWQRMVMMARCFDQRDLSFHTFRKSNYNDKNTLDVNVDALTQTNSPQNISSITFSSVNLQQISKSCNSNQEAPSSQGIVPSLEIQDANQVEMAVQNVADEINDNPA